MEPIVKKSNELARDFVLRYLKQKIVNLSLEPGAIISEAEISQELGVSRTPVREALIELSQVKLVEIYPQRGSYIAKIDYNIVDEVRYLRFIVETSIIELVCDLRTEEDLQKLQELVELQEFYLNKGKADVALIYDNELHSMFYSIANKTILKTIVDNVSIHFDRIRKLSFQAQKDMKIIKDHQQIVDAIRDRDKVKAVEVLTKHLMRYKVDETLLRKNYPEWIKN